MWCKDTSCAHRSEKKLSTSSIVTPPRLLRVIISIDPIEDGERERGRWKWSARIHTRKRMKFSQDKSSFSSTNYRIKTFNHRLWMRKKVTHHRLNSDQSSHGPVIAQHMLPSSLLTGGNYECRADENNCKSFNLPQIKPHWKFDPILRCNFAARALTGNAWENFRFHLINGRAWLASLLIKTLVLV